MIPSSKELMSYPSFIDVLNCTTPLNLTNFVAEFDIKIVDDNGTGTNYGGLEFRKTSSSHDVGSSGYLLYFRSNGQVGLYKNGTTIQEVQTTSSKAAHIKLVCQGTSMSVFVDGKQYISNATDAGFSGDFVGFRSQYAWCLFDNLVIYPINSTYSLQSYDPSTLEVLYKVETNGQRVSYEYDTLGRLIRMKGPNGETLKEITYKYSSEQ
jgi:YD repeat-containing protein